MGTPAIPVAGTTMVYVVMAVITLNVIGDAATNVIVNFKEGVLNKELYHKKIEK